MFLKYLSGVWAALAPAMGNHLWQSTLFAITAGLLTLALRKNRARARYWLWLAASVKFLVPFSLLVIVGSRLPWSRGSAGAKAGLSFVMEEVGQPFMQPMTSIASLATPKTIFASLIHLLPALLAVWLCGSLVVIFVWLLRRQRISAAIREATPLREGREVEVLRRLEHIEGIRKQTEILLSRASLEPGIFGIVQPILIWPERISERLEDAHLEAILAHELWHVRRHDNLAAAIHMVVEAIFWFHPLVWWLGARLLEERECACDEEVLESGRERQVYAESILKICEFCVGSPLTCVSGVTGADLKRRIARIMSKRVTRRLDLSRKLLLSAAGLLAVAVPIVFGLLHATQARAGSPAQNAATIASTFSDVSIKSNTSTGNAMHKMLGGSDGYTMENVTLRMLIGDVYGVQDDRISGAPEWLNFERYDIHTKIDKSVADELQKLSPEQRKLARERMLQALLAEHFKLTLHRETKDILVYVLSIDDNGPKLQLTKPGDTYPNGIKGLDGLPAGPHRVGGQRGQLTVQALPMATVASVLSRELGGRTILDRTGLKGEYDFTLRWTPDEDQAVILTAIEEQLGLKLETQKVPMEVLVIDHAERPSEPQTQNSAPVTPVYEVASIKLNSAGTAALKTGGIVRQRRIFGLGTFTGENNSLQELIRTAYGVEDYQVLGAPDWFTTQLYDVNAKAEKSAIDEMQKVGNDQRALENQRTLQTLLKQRFKLTLRQVTKDLPIYSLVLAEAGKLHEAQGDCAPGPTQVLDSGMPPCGTLRVFPWIGRLDGRKVPMTQLAANLSGFTKRMVLDNTNLGGKYDINLKWFPGPSEFPPRPAYLPPTYQPDPNSPPLLTAIQQQLGLKLESQTGPVPILVIDHVEMPLEN
jgi:uncharacterized protein (TIGR03435 family)